MQYRYLLIILLTLLTNSLIAQNRLTGKVLNNSGEPVVGATLQIEGTNRGAISEADGSFSISTDPKVASFVIKVSAMGFKQQNVTVNPQTQSFEQGLSIVLQSSATEMESVTVSARSRTVGSVASLYQAQRTAASISDGISAEVIRKAPDRNTGEVLKRISGTTIQDNKFVIIRGLSDRYNLGLSDGSLLPSTEPNRKAFSFDIIPSSMIDNITVTKSGTPDLPGDFAGGVINITTKEVPTRKFFDVSLGAGYNTVSTFKDYKSGYRSSTDFLGFDNGARQLPSDFPTTGFIINNMTQAQANTALASLNNDFEIRNRKALPLVNFSINGGDLRIFENGSKLGYTAGITYNHSEYIKPNQLRQYDDYNYVDNTYNYNTNLGALVNLAYQNKGGKYSLKNIYNRIFDDNLLQRQGIDIARTSDIQFNAFDLVQKSLFKSTFKGENRLAEGLDLDYLASFNLITNNRPDQRKIGYSKSLGSETPFSADLITLNRANNRLFGDLNEKIYNGSFNLKKEIDLFEATNIKVGGFAAIRNRDDENRLIGPRINVAGNSDYANILRRPLETLFAPELLSNSAYSLEDLTQANDSYTGKANNYAGYLMFDNKFTEKLRAVWGARYEYYRIDVTSPAMKFDKTWTDILPSANLTYALNPKNNIRASYFRSLARPEFREIAPFYYYDFEIGANLLGNPNLERSQINNFDLKYEWFPASGEIVSASLFYKKFKNTIESSIYKVNSALEVTTANFPSAEILGVEVELRKRLNFISESLKNLEFYTNIAIIESKVKYDQPLQLPRGNSVTERELTGQSPYMINGSLSYKTNDSKFSATVLFNRIGQRINMVGGNQYGMVYEQPRNILDGQLSYSISKHSDLRLNARDILNAPFRFYFDQNNNGKYDGSSFEGNINRQDKDWLLQEYRPGTNISVTYTYKL
jgi:outer membrane receptor protein involved in Fe transport